MKQGMTVVRAKVVMLRGFRLASGNDPRTIAVIDAVIRVEPTRHLIRRASDKQIDLPCYYFVARSDPHDFEPQRIVIEHWPASFIDL
jgi:hypothetical protein